MRSDLRDRVLHGLHPTFAVTLRSAAAVVERNDFVFEQAVDGSSIEFVLLTLVLVSAHIGECPTSTFAIAFIPPTIEYREVHNTIHQSLFTRRTRSFERTCWSVHPDVYTTHETTSQLHVVVVEEDNLTNELRTLRDVVNVLDEALTSTVSRVSLTCKEELYRVVRIVDNLCQTIEVREEEMSTLVSSEATSETNDERIGVNLVEE